MKYGLEALHNSIWSSLFEALLVTIVKIGIAGANGELQNTRQVQVISSGRRTVEQV